MKKILANKKGKRTGVKLSTTNKSKLRRSKKVEYLTKVELGPSKYIEYDKDGKVIGFISNSKKVHLADHLTDVAKKAMADNKAAKIAKKERIKQILEKVGYDPTVKYTRAEKKKFTRAVKKNLFVQPKLVNLTDEEIKMRFVEEKKRKVELLKERPHKNEIKSSVVDFLTKGKEALAKMKSNPKKEESKKYQYIIKQRSKEAPQKEIDLLTDYITAKSNTEAVETAKAKFRSMYENSKDKDSLTGLSVTPLDTKQSSYYPKDTILSWTSPEELKEKYSNVVAAAQ